MARTKPKRVARKVYLDAELSQLMDATLGARSVSDFVNDAIAYRLSKWESPADFVRAKREAADRTPVQDFDLQKCHPSGWPLNLDRGFWKLEVPVDEIANLRSGLKNDPDFAREVLEAAWKHAGLGKFSDADWSATLRWWEKNK